MGDYLQFELIPTVTQKVSKFFTRAVKY